MKVNELKAELTRLGKEIPEGAKKAELEQLVVTAHGAETGTPHLITAEDLVENPELATEGVKEGDVVILPPEESESEDGESTDEQTDAQDDSVAQEKPTQTNPDEYTVKSTLKHNGEIYHAGSTIVLNAREATTLREAGVI